MARLISVVIWLYLTLTHTTSIFSLPFTNYDSAAGCSIQPTNHQYQLSLSQSASPFQTNHFRIHFTDKEFKKIN
jgi:hypothetical protein